MDDTNTVFEARPNAREKNLPRWQVLPLSTPRRGIFGSVLVLVTFAALSSLAWAQGDDEDLDFLFSDDTESTAPAQSRSPANASAQGADPNEAIRSPEDVEVIRLEEKEVEFPRGPRTVVIDEIVVSARKREERTIDVPETIQAFSGEGLQAAGVETVKDLPRLTPNFQLVETLQPGSILINIRGVGQLRNGEAPIAYVVDGVQSSISNQITQSLFDVERIEVLKGPQGAVYGRNAIGGAVSVVTRQPTNEFEGRLEGKVANGEEYKLGLQFSGPIVEDKVLFRVAAQARDFRGLIWGENLQPEPGFVDDMESFSARANLLFFPTCRVPDDCALPA